MLAIMIISIPLGVKAEETESSPWWKSIKQENKQNMQELHSDYKDSFSELKNNEELLK